MSLGLDLKELELKVVAKRLVTVPRTGPVKFGPARKTKRKKTAAVMSPPFCSQWRS